MCGQYYVDNETAREIEKLIEIHSAGKICQCCLWQESAGDMKTGIIL